MAGVSRKVCESKVRRRWGTRVVSSLVMGLAFLLCAKTSSEEMEQSPVKEMETFLETCGILPAGDCFTRGMDLKRIDTIKIDLLKVEEGQIPENWQDLKSLTRLSFTGGETGEGTQLLKEMLVLAAEVPKLRWLGIQNINMEEVPGELFMIEKVTGIDLDGVTCSRVVIPKKHTLDHVKTFRLKKLQCEDNSVLVLLFSMHTIKFLEIVESKIAADLKSFAVKGGLSLNSLTSLIMKRVENTIVENLIRYVRMESLEYLHIERVDLGENLKCLEGKTFSNLEMIGLISTGTKSIEGLNGESLPVLRTLSLQGNPELRLDEEMCKKELLQKIENLTVELEAYMAYMKGMDIGSLLPKLEDFTLTREDVQFVGMRPFEQSNEKLEIDLKMDMNKEELGGLRIPHEKTWKEIKVRITANQEGMSQEQYGQVVTRMLRGCIFLERLVLRFTSKQEHLSGLEIIGSLDERGIFEHLESFEVIGVNVPLMVKPLGVEWRGDFSRVKGIWNEGKWELEGHPKVLKSHPITMFDTWVCSEKNKLISGGALGGTQGRYEEDKPTRICMVCQRDVGELETKRFVVLGCGHWICVECVNRMKIVISAISINQGQLILERELTCPSCGRASEYITLKELPPAVEELASALSSEYLMEIE
jgi:zinc-RING finger domain